MSDFLSSLKKRRIFSGITPIAGEVVLRLDERADGKAVLKILDDKGQEVLPDYRRYQGPLCALLRYVHAVRADMGRQIAWGGGGDALVLDEQPNLMRYLLACPGVQDKDGQPLQHQGGLFTLHLYLHPGEGGYLPEQELMPEDERIGQAQMSFRLLTDSYAVTDTHQLLELLPLGENYRVLGDLLQMVPTDQAEMFLSVVLSSFDNLHIHVAGMECEYADLPVHSRPTLVFEKVDEEKSLYLRVTESIPGVPMQFLEDFSPSRLASFSPDGRVVVREVAYADTAALEKDIRKSITACSPSRAAAREIYQDDGFFILPPETAEAFLIGHLASLAQEYVLLGAEKLASFQIRKVAPRLKISSFSGIDYLEGKGEVQLEDVTLSLSDFLSQYRKNRYVQIAGGDRLIVDADYVYRLERLVSRSTKSGKVKISFFDLLEVAALLSEVPDEGIFRRSRSFYEGFNELPRKRFRTPKELKATLRPYQREGVKWLKYLYDNDMGGCLADDMGLGKTVEAIALITQVLREDSLPFLIVMPRSLLFNWQAEWQRFAPDVSVATYYGTARNWDEVKSARVILTTYALVRNDIEALAGTVFDTIILDESQHVKNLSAKMSQAVLLLHAGHRFALSGTPVENHLGELYALMRFLNPAMLGSAEDFNRKFAVPIQHDNDREAMDMLKRKISPFILRRVKEEVLTELPERINQTLIVEMEPAHAAFYERRRRYYAEAVRASIKANGVAKSQFELLQALTELRRIASVPESLSDGAIASSKIPVLAEAVVEAVENGHKSVVFFNFIAGIELLGQVLQEEGIDFEVMTGTTRDRASVVGRFQWDERCKVLLMTLKTGGVGLNLTAADTVFVAEPWWNRAAEEQAIGRLHRIGQNFSVHAYALVVKDTIEEKIRLLQEQKATLIEELIQSEGATGKWLSEEDINFILG